MSIILKGVKAPETCMTCPCFQNNGDFCMITDTDYYFNNGKNPDCCILSLPEHHGRLIDADRMLAVFKSAYPKEYRGYLFEGIITTIENAPTIIEAEENT